MEDTTPNVGIPAATLPEQEAHKEHVLEADLINAQQKAEVAKVEEADKNHQAQEEKPIEAEGPDVVSKASSQEADLLKAQQEEAEAKEEEAVKESTEAEKAPNGAVKLDERQAQVQGPSGTSQMANPAQNQPQPQQAQQGQSVPPAQPVLQTQNIPPVSPPQPMQASQAQPGPTQQQPQQPPQPTPTQPYQYAQKAGQDGVVKELGQEGVGSAPDATGQAAASPQAPGLIEKEEAALDAQREQEAADLAAIENVREFEEAHKPAAPGSPEFKEEVMQAARDNATIERVLPENKNSASPPTVTPPVKEQSQGISARR